MLLSSIEKIGASSILTTCSSCLHSFILSSTLLEDCFTHFSNFEHLLPIPSLCWLILPPTSPRKEKQSAFPPNPNTPPTYLHVYTQPSVWFLEFPTVFLRKASPSTYIVDFILFGLLEMVVPAILSLSYIINFSLSTGSFHAEIFLKNSLSWPHQLPAHFLVPHNSRTLERISIFTFSDFYLPILS